MSAHSKLPWSVGAPGNIVCADGYLITSIPRGKGAGATARRDADTALIVDRVNVSRLALAERVREACAEAAREHSCMTYSELCDCGGKIAKDIRALDLSKLVEGE